VTEVVRGRCTFGDSAGKKLPFDLVGAIVAEITTEIDP
jgi:hypothetical protein